MKINVDINRQRVRLDGKCAVRMDIHLKGRGRHAFPFAIEPKRWDAKLRRVRPGPLAVEYNRTIANTIARAEVLALEPGMTARVIVERIGGPDPSGKPFTELARLYNEGERYRISGHTIRIRETVLRDLDRSCPNAPGLTMELLRTFDKYLVGLGIAPNTVRARMKMLRTMYRGVASMTGQESREIFAGLIRSEQETTARSLSGQEVKVLELVRLPTYDQQVARDAFLFSMYTGGVRFGDLCRLKPGNVEDGALVYTASKSKRALWIPLVPQALKIIADYKGEGYLLPILNGRKEADGPIGAANTATNKRLRKVAKAAGINPRVSMHWARHSFALWAAENDVPIDLLRMIFGHSSLAVTQKYMRKHARGALREVFDKLRP